MLQKFVTALQPSPTTHEITQSPNSKDWPEHAQTLDFRQLQIKADNSMREPDEIVVRSVYYRGNHLGSFQEEPARINTANVITANELNQYWLSVCRMRLAYHSLIVLTEKYEMSVRRKEKAVSRTALQLDHTEYDMLLAHTDFLELQDQCSCKRIAIDMQPDYPKKVVAVRLRNM